MSAESAVRRDAILDAAVGCFARYGFRRTSMDTIARAAHMSRPALYQYFTGKEEVFRAMGVRMMEAALAEAERHKAGPAPILEKLSAILLVRMNLTHGQDVVTSFGRDLLADIETVAGDLLASFNVRMIAILESVLTNSDELDVAAAQMSAHDVAVLLLDALAGIDQTGDAYDVKRGKVRRLAQLTVSALRSAVD
ncbi:MAG TPA: helix-turn-helix domain-containing protein [Actinopolymorphaceae bacterium]